MSNRRRNVGRRRRRTGSVAGSLGGAFYRPSEVDTEHATVELVEVHVVDGILGVGGGGVRNERETSVLRF